MTSDRNLCLISLAGLAIPFIGPFVVGATIGFCYLAVDGENMKEELKETDSRLQDMEMELYELNKSKSSNDYDYHVQYGNKLSVDHITEYIEQASHTQHEGEIE